MSAGDFAAVGLAFYTGHRIGDYWVQTDHQAQHKGLPGVQGRVACTLHCLSYVGTQFACLLLLVMVATPMSLTVPGMYVALAVSGITHYMADRREYGLMLRLARLLPGKAAFMRLGVPRQGLTFYGTNTDHTDDVEVDATDNPQLATGAWALDQSWHILFSVFVPALLAVSL